MRSKQAVKLYIAKNAVLELLHGLGSKYDVLNIDITLYILLM